MTAVEEIWILSLNEYCCNNESAICEVLSFLALTFAPIAPQGVSLHIVFTAGFQGRAQAWAEL